MTICSVVFFCYTGEGFATQRRSVIYRIVVVFGLAEIFDVAITPIWLITCKAGIAEFFTTR